MLQEERPPIVAVGTGRRNAARALHLAAPSLWPQDDPDPFVPSHAAPRSERAREQTGRVGSHGSGSNGSEAGSRPAAGPLVPAEGGPGDPGNGNKAGDVAGSAPWPVGTREGG